MSILNKIADFILHILGHLPEELKHAAEKALAITTKIHDTLNSQEAIVIASLIPEGEEVREAIEKVLEALIPALQAEGNIDVQQAILAKIGAKITAEQHGNELPQNRYDLAFQTVYSSKK